MKRLIVCLFVGYCIFYQANPPQSKAELSLSADVTTSILVNGYTRNYMYTISAAPAPPNGRPLVIRLHGDGGNMNLATTWKNALLNDSNGAVLLAPQGRNKIPAASAIDGSAWRFRMDESGREYDDVDFINTLITQAINNNLLGTPINPDQVYLVGESRGAGFAYFLYADPRTRNKVRAIVPISGTFYCDGAGATPSQPVAGSDLTCGQMSGGYWGPKPSLFTDVTRTAHILDVHGEIPADGGTEFTYTAPPKLDVSWGSTTWSGWSDAAGCFTEKVSSQTQQILPYLIGSKEVRTYAYSQASNNLATRCTTLDLTFYIVQDGKHVPIGFEPTAWCFLSTIGGTPSSTACAANSPATQTPTATSTSTATATPTSTATATQTSTGVVTRSILVNGYTRNYMYTISNAAAPPNGRPLVIRLHGDGGNMNLATTWKNAVLNDSNGAVLLAPQGRNQIPAASVIDGSAWRFRMDESGREYDDVDFINALITQATTNNLLGTPIDPDQVYLVGESRGAGFAYFLYADPRTRNKVRAIVPISGTFYCDGAGATPSQPAAGSDLTCGQMSYGYWGPKPSLFTGVTRTAHILDVHGELPADGGTELTDTAPPDLDVSWGSTTWSGWSEAAGCFTEKVSSQTQQILPDLIGGKEVRTYAYSQASNNLATRCSTLDLTFYIVQDGKHVPIGFEPTAWCFLSTVGGTPSSTACAANSPATPTPTATSTATATPTSTATATPTSTGTVTATSTATATPTTTTTSGTPTSTATATPTTTPVTWKYWIYIARIQR